MNVHSSFMHYSSKFTTGEWIKEIVVHPYSGLLLRYEKEGASDTHSNVDETQAHYAE